MRPIINLNLKGTSNAEIVINADHYITNVTGNPMFPDPESIALVTALGVANIAMRKAVAAPISETKKDNIRMARETLDRSITMLAGKVQSLANSPDIPDSVRLDYIHNAGMVEKGSSHPQKQQFRAINGNRLGTVHIIAKGGAKSHEWQYTTDIVTYKDRVAAETTTTSKTLIINLEEGTKYAFFHKPTIVRTITQWEGPFILRTS